uniref:Uncharacterized protein n=1 Tax=Brassica oleracea TaxID=3712 RepID=A0A3P6CNE2_BRAOL|nr:unnamed protein product [Brassica oleracea]
MTRVCLGSMTTLWIRRGNVGVRCFCLNPTPGYSANLAKLIFQEFVIRANRSSLLDLTHWCLPVTAVCAQKPSYLVDSSFLCSSWSRTNMYSKMEVPSMEPCKLGLELHSYLSGAIVGVNPQSLSQSHHQSLPPTRANGEVLSLRALTGSGSSFPLHCIFEQRNGVFGSVIPGRYPFHFTVNRVGLDAFDHHQKTVASSGGSMEVRQCSLLEDYGVCLKPLAVTGAWASSLINEVGFGVGGSFSGNGSSLGLEPSSVSALKYKEVR